MKTRYGSRGATPRAHGRRLGIVALALGGVLAGMGEAPASAQGITTLTANVDAKWIVHTDATSTCARGQHITVSWGAAGVGYYRLAVRGVNIYGSDRSDTISYTSAPTFLEGGGAVEVYSSPCFALSDHGRGWVRAMVLSCLSPTLCADPPDEFYAGPVEADDWADCHWGHDFWCAEHSGD
ncbi:MAG TPA: hypothetical protein VGB64_08575 [Actinomycetota bacterium]